MMHSDMSFNYGYINHIDWIFYINIQWWLQDILIWGVWGEGVEKLWNNNTIFELYKKKD